MALSGKSCLKISFSSFSVKDSSFRAIIHLVRTEVEAAVIP
jgi:hypothetical protein